MSFKHWDQGFYNIVNKNKYLGKSAPIYRSSWEKKCFVFLDLNNNVIAWSSERHIVPYKLPKEFDGTGKIRRYFVDLYCEVKQKDGTIKKFLIEVKPLNQCQKPTLPKNGRVTSGYKQRMNTYVVNQFKWNAAKLYSESKGFEWMILTEKDIFNSNQ